MKIQTVPIPYLGTLGLNGLAFSLILFQPLANFEGVWPRNIGICCVDGSCARGPPLCPPLCPSSVPAEATSGCLGIYAIVLATCALSRRPIPKIHLRWQAMEHIQQFLAVERSNSPEKYIDL